MSFPETSLRRTLERLRVGTPPFENLALFTHGYRRLEDVFRDFLHSDSTTRSCFWIRGPYGAGKSHTLAAMREIAEGVGFASSYVSLDASTCAANHPQRVVPYLLRNLRIPGRDGGYQALLQRLLSAPSSAKALEGIVDSSLSGGRNLDLWCRGIFFQLNNSDADDPTRRELNAELVELLCGDLLSSASGSANTRSAAYRLLQIAEKAVRLEGLAGLLLELDEVESIFTKLRDRRSRRGAYRALSALGMWRGLTHTRLALAVTPDGDRWFRSDIFAQQNGIDVIEEEPVALLAREVSSSEQRVLDCEPLGATEIRNLVSIVSRMHCQAYGIAPSVVKHLKEPLIDAAVYLAQRGLSPRLIIRQVVGCLDAARYEAQSPSAVPA